MRNPSNLGQHWCLWSLGLTACLLVGLGLYGMQILVTGRDYVPWLSECSTNLSSRVSLGTQQRIVNTPQDSTPDAELQFSLLDEANYLTTISPYLHVSSDGLSSEPFGISFYHQLHCLDALRTKIIATNLKPHEIEHLIHCIDYISQVCFLLSCKNKHDH